MQIAATTEVQYLTGYLKEIKEEREIWQVPYIKYGLRLNTYTGLHGGILSKSEMNAYEITDGDLYSFTVGPVGFTVSDPQDR